MKRNKESFIGLVLLAAFVMTVNIAFNVFYAWLAIHVLAGFTVTVGQMLGAGFLLGVCQNTNGTLSITK